METRVGSGEATVKEARGHTQELDLVSYQVSNRAGIRWHFVERKSMHMAGHTGGPSNNTYFFFLAFKCLFLNRYLSELLKTWWLSQEGKDAINMQYKYSTSTYLS
jgi:hypothetical protein